MEILHLHSIQEISVTYSTGDAPLFVLSEKGITIDRIDELFKFYGITDR